LLSTVYNYTLSFVIEEQAVFPRPGERSEQYDLQKRSENLSPETLPLMRQAGPILFDRFERRYKEGLALILQGAACRIETRKKG
jgi:TetR/AcrR family transcriptional regulator, tetracycline repressor protein